MFNTSCSEPPLSVRPVHAFRYTAITDTDQRIGLPANYWSRKSEIYDIDGSVMINADELQHIRKTLGCPTVLSSFPPSPTNEETNTGSLSNAFTNTRIELKLDICRFCGLPDCEAKFLRGFCKRKIT